jgi:hypothetical protein
MDDQAVSDYVWMTTQRVANERVNLPRIRVGMERHGMSPNQVQTLLHSAQAAEIDVGRLFYKQMV